METMALIYVAAGGAFGSLMRYLCALAIGASEFPLATFIVNVTGSLLMGVWIGLVALVLPDKAKDLHLLVAVGALGGFTTFSAFSLDIFTLFERNAYGQLALYVGGSLLLSVFALILGMVLVKLVAV